MNEPTTLPTKQQRNDPMNEPINEPTENANSKRLACTIHDSVNSHSEADPLTFWQEIQFQERNSFYE